MKMKILPTLIAGIVIFNGAIAGDREFLFGPGKSSEVQEISKKVKVKTKKKKSVVAQSNSAQVSTAAVAVTASAVASIAAASVLTAGAATLAPIPIAPAIVPVPVPVKTAEQAKPVLVPSPAVAVVAVDIPKMPSLPALKESKTLISTPALPTDNSTKESGKKPESINIAAGSDPLKVREELIKKLSSQVSVGFFPSATKGNDNYSFLTSFMPLANYLSEKTGVLVNFIPERSLKEYGTHISEARYPVIFINAILAREALAAGYKPVAMGQEDLEAGYFVKASSRIKKIEEINNVKIAWSLNAQTSVLAMSDINRLGLKGNTFEDIGISGRSGVVAAIKSNSAEVGVWRAKDIKKTVEESDGALRLLGVGSSAPSSGMWVRGDMVDNDLFKKMVSSLLTVGPDSNDASAKDASLAFSKGFGVRGQFIPPSESLTREFNDLFSSAKQSFPAFFSEVYADQQELEKNMKMAVIVPLVKTKVQDVMTERDALTFKLKTKMTAGFFPSATRGNDNYSFVSSFMPLSNYLSKKTEVLINFIPERNIGEYAKRIDEYYYPLIFINAILSRNALAAGYIPLVSGKDTLAPGFMVRADSPIKKIGDIKGFKIAWSINEQTSLLAMADFGRLGLVGNTYSDVGSSGRVGTLNALSNGSADVAIWRSNEFEKMNDPKFRYIGEGTSASSSGVWIRSDLAETDFAKKIEKLLIEITPESTDSEVKNASLSYTRGSGTVGQFVQISSGFVNETINTLETAQKFFPEFFSEISPDAKSVDANLAKKAINPIKAK